MRNIISCFIIKVALLAGLLAVAGCQKNKIYDGENAQLHFSEEIMTFDTVFTTIGSITKILKVNNPYKNTVKTDIALISGGNSYFSVNVDGVFGTVFKDVEIRGKDSIFIFVKVNINPNNQNMPIFISDTLAFSTNGNRQNVELRAFGEDANFILPDTKIEDSDGDTISCKIIAKAGETITWTNTKPYVIYGYAVISPNAKLIIDAGTQIYVHKNGGILVSPEGCINVNGTKEAPIVFQGDRKPPLEYDNAQWCGIWISEGRTDNIINYAVIKNAIIGIRAESSKENMGNKLLLTNTEIRCSQHIGFMGKNYNVQAYNNIFSISENYCVSLSGGSYTFIHNTVYNQYFSRKMIPSVKFSNDTTDFTCFFVNNIVYGNFDKELQCSSNSNARFELFIENCLIKTEKSILDNYSIYSDVIFNQNPSFKDVKNANVLKYDFSLNDDSPCKRAGKTIVEVPIDIVGTTRNNPPSIGAYE